VGWADCGTDSKGRPIGYAHAATCDEPGCEAKIDRGLAYKCGPMHGEDVYNCEDYFCERHRVCVQLPDGTETGLCRACREALEIDDDLRVIGPKEKA
jgi:hypothetical protein